MAEYTMRKLVGGNSDGKLHLDYEQQPCLWVVESYGGEQVSIYIFDRIEKDGNVILRIYEVLEHRDDASQKSASRTIGTFSDQTQGNGASHADGFNFGTPSEGESMATAEQQLAELRRELADLAKQAERLAGRSREISDRLGRGEK